MQIEFTITFKNGELSIGQRVKPDALGVRTSTPAAIQVRRLGENFQQTRAVQRAAAAKRSTAGGQAGGGDEPEPARPGGGDEPEPARPGGGSFEPSQIVVFGPVVIDAAGLMAHAARKPDEAPAPAATPTEGYKQ